ncbi:hypothetical protein EZV62_022232 [Acer yangbiense]|uniref:Uncharacterized protein n=1 Tax=Acer yangbiense TaxID=1000413 RepID=A0A5C7H7N6_9ROSI|nr:hypothetical protein EZV62_022232 [Acer yangbiense]
MGEEVAKSVKTETKKGSEILFPAKRRLVKKLMYDLFLQSVASALKPMKKKKDFSCFKISNVKKCKAVLVYRLSMKLQRFQRHNVSIKEKAHKNVKKKNEVMISSIQLRLHFEEFVMYSTSVPAMPIASPISASWSAGASSWSAGASFVPLPVKL